MNQPSTRLCPTREQLAKLVSGRVEEETAELMFVHVDDCSSCQKHMDLLAKKPDDVLQPVKKVPRRNTPPTLDAHLSDLIQRVQVGSTQDTKTGRDSATQIVSELDFVENLRRSGLLPQNEIDQLLSDLSWDRTQSADDSKSLAKQLVRSQKLTHFQARLLVRGKYKGLVLGSYSILDKLGQGGMGSVFKARHTKMGRIVCLKVVNSAGRQSPYVIERFRNEARALAKLNHPNIIVAHDANEAKGVPYLVMEFIDGEDLSKRIKKDGPLTVEDTLEVSMQIAEALRYAHSRGVIHRDVKPHNVVVHRNKENKVHVKVLDLGLVRFNTMVTENPEASILAAMTNTGIVIGTVDFMSPEQALDSRCADERSDIYSLGCTIYFLLIGRPPFEGDTVIQRLIAHRETRPRSLSSFMKSDITPEINAVVQKMLRKDPDDRYQTMQEVFDDLQRLARGEQPSVEVKVKKKRKRSGRPVTVEPPPIESGTTALVDSGVNLLVNEQPVEKAKSGKAGESGESGKSRESSTSAPSHLRPLLAAALVVATLAGSLWVYWPQVAGLMAQMKMQRVGADLAARNGGDGRVLLIVSSKKFHQDQFQHLISHLDKRGVDVATASPNFGTEKPDFGKEFKSGFDNMNLRDVKSDEFDAVFVLGGDTWDLSHKVAENHKQMKRILNSALATGTAIGSCGCGILRDGVNIGDKKFKGVPKLETDSKEELAKFADRVIESSPARKPS